MCSEQNGMRHRAHPLTDFTLISHRQQLLNGSHHCRLILSLDVWPTVYSAKRLGFSISIWSIDRATVFFLLFCSFSYFKHRRRKHSESALPLMTIENWFYIDHIQSVSPARTAKDSPCNRCPRTHNTSTSAHCCSLHRISLSFPFSLSLSFIFKIFEVKNS